MKQRYASLAPAWITLAWITLVPLATAQDRAVPADALGAPGVVRVDGPILREPSADAVARPVLRAAPFAADRLTGLAPLAGGTGTNGFELWVQASVRYQASTAAEDAAGTPSEVALETARPNPFRATATLAYAVPSAGAVRLSVYDALGREVARLVDAVQPAGRYHATLDGSRLAAGLYFCRLEAAGRAVTTRVVRVP